MDSETDGNRGSTVENPEPVGIESFFSNILKPGSSLHPTFLAIVDSSFAALLLILLILAFLTSGNPHFFALILIVLCLWASVKWFVNELKKMPARNPDEDDIAQVQEKEKKDE